MTACREIQQLAKHEGLEVIEINPKTAKKLVSGNGSITKREVARIICSRFPELRIYLGQTHKYKDKYWQNMFDAVGDRAGGNERSRFSIYEFGTIAVFPSNAWLLAGLLPPC